MLRGENIVKRATFGYRKNLLGKWEPDEESAAIVQKIFALAIKGFKTSKIRDILESEHHLTPGQYLTKYRGINAVQNDTWTTTMVWQILKNEQYTGDYISGKFENKSVGSQNHKRVDRSKWIVIPNSHTPLVSKELFIKAQEVIGSKKVNQKNRSNREYLLRSKVMCGCCKHSLSYDLLGGPAFRCLNTLANPNAKCHKMKVNAAKLDDTILTMIRKKAEILLNCENLNNLRNKNNAEQQISEYEKLIQTSIEQRQYNYERFILHEIDSDEYSKLKSKCNSELDMLNKKLASLKVETQSEQLRQKSLTIAKDVITEAVSHRELIDVLINKVHVYPDYYIEVDWKIADFTAEK
jgi:hypothetical protein